MLLIATALVLALSQAALAAGLGLAPTPTAKQHVAAAVFARQTGRRVLDECSSVLDNFLDLPTPPPDLSSYAQQVAATQTGAAAIRFPDSLSSRASKYQSSVLSWCSEQRDALTKCTELPALQSQYSGVCQAAGGNAAATGANGGTDLGINIFNNFDTGGGGGGAGGAGSSAGGGGGGGGGGGNGGSNGGDGSSGGGGTSSGAIAGIVIGVLAAVGVLAGIAAFVIWRARRKRAAANSMDAARQQPMSGQQTPPSGMLHSLGQASTYDKDSPTYSESSYQSLPHAQSVHEMPGVRAPAELMGSTEAVPVELHNPEPVYEMLADYRPNKAAVANVGYKS
ncbi:hypothetical protein MGU_10099 [Metarhizium guizhouense ARSEF 977]|uniref:Uncharacterized protein n=1 Tax=Metarhizium guizhouense (strain ARSEF 977) TaxID=1276136 RepID=A0A0B4G7H9_METGA|nr:hypothetical protein MGU_10099 [Metarhizium guizhouense ARSEF 977]